eukprot:scaffold74548_cov16-Tisochrysis_lutea.AAC.2
MKALRGQTVVQKGALAPNGFLVPRGQVRSSARGVASPSLIGERSLGIRAALPIVRQQAAVRASALERDAVTSETDLENFFYLKATLLCVTCYTHFVAHKLQDWRDSPAHSLRVNPWTESCPLAPERTCLHWSSKKRHSVVVAVSAPEQQDTKFAVDETFSLPKGNETVRATVEQKADGAQTVRLTTSLQAGRLLLHWGVEGGKDYQGGWRLPSTCRPPGTKQYKDRALQSPFQVDDQGSHLFIMLSAEEASDVLNFVLKDEATNTWYDNSGSNFRLPLHGEASGKPSTGTQLGAIRLHHIIFLQSPVISRVPRLSGRLSMLKTGALKFSRSGYIGILQGCRPTTFRKSKGKEVRNPNFHVIPKALADKWAWMRWDHQGRPQQSMPDANKDYDRGVEGHALPVQPTALPLIAKLRALVGLTAGQPAAALATAPPEMRALMGVGRSMDELWRVAEGKWPYPKYLD